MPIAEPEIVQTFGYAIAALLLHFQESLHGFLVLAPDKQLDALSKQPIFTEIYLCLQFAVVVAGGDGGVR